MTAEARSQAPGGSGGALAATVLVGIALFLFAGVVFGGDTFGAANHVFGTIPALDALGDGLRAGELLEWWDRVGLGVPLAGDPDHAALYPLTWLAALGGPRAIDAMVAVHMVAAGAGSAALSRRLGAGPLGAATAGGAMLGAQLASSVATVSAPVMALAWAPWIVWASDRIRPGRGALTGTLGLAALIGAQLCTGQLSIAIASVIAAAAIAAARRRAGQLLWIAAAAIAGGLLACHVILSAMYVELSGTAPLGDAWSIRDLASVIWPGVWYIGLPTVCVAVAVVVDRIGPGGPGSGPGGATRMGAAPSSNVGQGASVAALVGIALIASAIWFGAAPALVGAAVVSAVAGASAEKLATRGGSTTELSAIIAVAFAAVVGASAVGVAATDIASAGVATCVLAACAAACRRVKWRAWSGPLLCAVLVGHSVTHAKESSVRVARAGVLSRPALIGDLQSDRMGHRLARPALPGDRSDSSLRDSTLTYDSVESRRLAKGFASDATSLAPNTATLHGMSYVPGRSRAVDERLRRVWRAAAPHAERFLDLYAIPYIVVPASVAIPSGMPIIGKSPDGRLALARNRDLRPRAFVAPKWRWFAGEDELLLQLFPPARDASPAIGLSTVRLVGSGTDSRAAGPVRARPCDLEIGFDRAALDCDARDPGWAVLLDAQAPGWSATVDGVSVAIERADLLARAVWIERGAHRIEFTYRTPGLRLGAAVAALAWLNLLLAWLIAVRKQSGADSTR